MLSQIFWAAILSNLVFAAPAGKLQARDDFDNCIANSWGSICSPINDAPSKPIGDHIGVVLVATGVFHSTGVSTALRSKKNGKITPLSWNQRDANGIDNGNDYFRILTSHNGGIFYGSVGKAFAGEGQFPCSLFDDNPGGEGKFEWLLTHYFGEHCTYNNTKACFPGLINVPPFSGSKTILLKDNAEVCGR